MKKMTLRDFYVQHGSLERTAEALGIGRNSVQGWLSGTILPSFKSQLHLLRHGISIAPESFPD